MKIRICLLSALLFFCSGCFVVQVDDPVVASEPIKLRKNFFLLGRIGEHDIDLNKTCPSGVASFGDRFRFSDIVLNVVTLGLYTPRTVVIKCRA